MSHYAGLDVSLEETAICVVDGTGRIVREMRVPSEPEAGVSPRWAPTPRACGSPQGRGQIETPRLPDPIMRRPERRPKRSQ